MKESITGIEYQEAVEEFINRNIRTYKNDRGRIISDYRGEKGFTEAYIGRQLFELLQNADDARTDKVLISIDTENCKLSVANNGLPFDLLGVESLMLANTSPKNKKEFIGNKGLGFRSILNWVTSVKIKTKNIVLEFSPEIAKREFEKLIPNIQDRQKLIEKEDELPDGDVPFAILAIPDFNVDTEEQEWETIIEVNYNKRSENDILEQINSITAEVLLFLNHIQEIEIAGASTLDKILKLEKSNKDEDIFLNVSGIEWQLFDSGDLSLPNNPKKFYRYKIAWQENLCDIDSCFFTYFPTEVATHLPYLIHATFDLDPSRKYLNKTNDNRHILSEIAKKLAYLASAKIKNEGTVDWKPVQFLSIEGKSENSLLVPFFSEINKFKDSLNIYPCIDGLYRSKSEVKYYGDDFSDWVIRNKTDEYFPGLLLPFIQGLSLTKWIFESKFTLKDWSSIFESVTHKIESLEERVELISLLLSDDFLTIHNRVQLPLLLDDKGMPVSQKIQVSTRKSGSTTEYQIPKYVNITFIDPGFLDLLLKKLTYKIASIKLPNDNNETRPLKKLLYPIVNIGSNDITDVVRIMTNAINNELTEDLDTNKYLIKQYIKSLFEIYRRNIERKGILDENIQIKVINRLNNLVRTNEVYLGNEFISGITTELLFDGVYTDENYIKGNDFWEISSENFTPELIENFFLWLGVNKYSRFKKNKKQLNGYEDDEYIKFVFSKIDRPKFNISKNYEVSSLSNYDEIINSKEFTIEKLVAWAVIDNMIYSQLNDDFNQDYFSYEYNRNYFSINTKPSYIKYQLVKDNLFSNVVLDFDFADQLGLESIDLDNELFKKLDIDKVKAVYVLKALGAKMSFNDLNTETVYSLIRTCGEKKSDPIYANKLYLLALSNFQVSKTKNFESYEKEFDILATNNKVKEYKPIDKVYYSDNATLPSKIVEQFWIFDFPKRRGEKQISEYFGVKTFKDIIIEICNEPIQAHSEENNLKAWIEKIKPYILTYRLNSLKDKTGKTVSGTLKGLSIKLVRGLRYQVNGGEIKELLPGEFLNEKHTFYLCANSESTLEQLKDTPAICEAFSEILCVLFEVNENKDDYRTIFKDKPDLKDTKYLIEIKSLKAKFEDAFKLLGLSFKEHEFWKNIFKKHELQFPDNVGNLAELQEIVFLKLKYRLPEFYSRVNFDTFENQESFDFLMEVCSNRGFSLTQIKEFNPDFTGLAAWHQTRFSQAIHDVDPLWNKACWLFFSQKQEAEQRLFEAKRKVINQKIYPIVTALSAENSFISNLNYEDIIINSISTEFDILIEKDQINDVVIENKYPDLLRESNLDFIDLPEEIQSLTFFEGNYEVIKEEFMEIKKNEPSESNPKVTPKEIESTEFINTSLSMGNIPISKRTGSGGHGHGGIHNHKKERQNRKAGKRAEILVRDKLISIFPDGEVRIISGNSDDNTVKPDDSKGYDIIYKKNKIDQNWYYLEVKSISGDSFIISANEVNVGIKEKNRYHLALVNDLKIYFVEDFFMNSERVLEFNTIRNSSSIRALDYEVFFKINNTNIAS